SSILPTSCSLSRSLSARSTRRFCSPRASTPCLCAERASSSSERGASPLNVRTLAHRRAIVPSRAPPATRSSAEPTPATMPTTIAPARHTTGSPRETSRPSDRSASSLSGVAGGGGLTGSVLRVLPLRSAIEILQLVVQARVVRVLGGPVLGRRGLACRRRRDWSVALPPAADHASEPDCAERDSEHGDDPDGPEDARVRRDRHRL